MLDDFERVYAALVNSNEKWEWEKDIIQKRLGDTEKAAIKKLAVEKGDIEDIPFVEKNGKLYADFKSAGVVVEEVDLPEWLWKAGDKQQFDYLNEEIGGKRDKHTWHHTETPGKMQLVPFGIHNVTNHSGGRTSGMWADAPRNQSKIKNP